MDRAPFYPWRCPLFTSGHFLNSWNVPLCPRAKHIEWSVPREQGDGIPTHAIRLQITSARSIRANLFWARIHSRVWMLVGAIRPAPKFIRRGWGCKRSALGLFTGLKWDTRPSPHVTLKHSSAVDDPVACSTRSLCRTDSIADLKGPGSESHPNAYQVQGCWMWCRGTTVHTNPASLVCFRVADIFQSTEDTWWPFVLIPGQDPIPPTLNPGV